MRRVAPSIVLAALIAVPHAARAGDAVEFNRDIRPILAENCYLCHGPDRSHRKGGLRLDDRTAAIAKQAIVPDRPGESELIARIASDDPDEVMPPREANKTLTDRQKDLLRRWIAEGAKYQSHWAYEPIRRPDAPRTAAAGWSKNPVDAFVLAGLEARGITPSPRADPRTLLRRLSLDLIGLPPDPETVARFEQDPSDAAYEREVDRLLASPRYGERMAVPWLDLVRFADTVGYHGDQNQHSFPFRDYVINAFNANMPFDRFTAEQVAGDLLPEPTSDQLVASGFNRLNMMTREGGAQPREYLAKYAGDRVRTVAITWLGSTLGCAECHDHKFDPFTAKDFYRLSAFFADVEQWGVYMDYAYTPNPDLRGYSNDHPFPPEIEVDSPYLKRRIERLDRQIAREIDSAAARRRADPDRADELEAWVRDARSFIDRNSTGWEPAKATLSLVADGDRSGPESAKPDIRLVGKARSKDATSITLAPSPSPGRVASIRMELSADDQLASNPGVSGLIHLSASLRSDGDAQSTRISFAWADADAKVDRYVNGSAVVGIIDGWKAPAPGPEEVRRATWVLDRPIDVREGDRITLAIRSELSARVAFSASPIGFEDAGRATVSPDLIGAIRAEPSARSAEQVAALERAYLLGTGRDRPALEQVQRLVRERAECRGGKAPALITKRREPMPTRVLPRGNWQDESGEAVEPGVPHFLPQPSKSEGWRLDRLDLARWLTAPENPLTARVFANRVWKQLFGTGLSAVMEDVGAQGEWPSHPELLDWLADEFRRGWDVKALVKTIVMSAAYRQDARLRPELRESDPGNRLLASQSPRRLEAEFVRDNALAIAGLLDDEVGGPSSFPYQPPGYYAVIQFPDRDYRADRDERQYRRGVYSHWQRTFLQPMLANFDAPSREECIAGRTVANTPQQALTLLNDPTFVEAARVFAGSILTGPDRSDDDRVDRIYRKALARPARPRELESLRRFLDARRSEARDGSDEPRKLLAVGIAPNPGGVDERELAAWTEVCRVVLNLHETITRY